jgi:hypothetical protein
LEIGFVSAQWELILMDVKVILMECLQLKELLDGQLL